MATTELTGNTRYGEMSTYVLTQPESSVVHGLTNTLEDLMGFATHGKVHQNCVMCVFARKFKTFQNMFKTNV